MTRTNGPPPSTQAGTAAPASRPPNDPGLVRLLAEAIASAETFACDAGGLLYRYRDGVYVPDAEQHIKHEVKHLLLAWDRTSRWNTRLVEQVVAYLAADAAALWERPSLSVINLANGLLDLSSGTLVAHNPLVRTTVQLPVCYAPHADCPAWDAFLAAVLPADVYAAGIIWQLLASLMIPCTDAHQAILLSGLGGNGKSTLLAAIRAFLGEPNISSLNLNQITGERFAAAHLFGKLANICDDLSSRHLGDTSTFKRVVGGDAITADRKHREPIVFRPFARLLFSANEYPQSSDASSGFYERWVVIPFARGFRGQRGEIPRQVLDAQLAAPHELSGALNRALAAMPSVLGRGLPMTCSMRDAWDEFRNATDWVLIWLERVLVECATVAIEKKAIHQALIIEAQRRRRAVISPSALYAKIRQHWPNVSEAQRRINPTRNGLECFVGLTWRTGFPP
jgi:putative DNA primase/helicase